MVVIPCKGILINTIACVLENEDGGSKMKNL